MKVELLASRGSGGKPGDILDVPIDEAQRLFRKGMARVYRERVAPEKATKRRKPERAKK